MPASPLDRQHERDDTGLVADDQRQQFAIAVFVSPRADDLLGVLLALDINEASAIQQAYEFARDTWGRNPASLHYVAAEHGVPRVTRRRGR